MPWIYLGTTPIKGIYVWTTPVKEVYLWTTKIRPEIPPYLAFERSNNTMTIVYIKKVGNPTSVNIECSLDGANWDTFNIGYGRQVPSSWKLYFRNASSTDTWFSTWSGDYYYFEITWKAKASGELGYLLNKNNTTALTGNYCFYKLFSSCSSLETAPILNATTMKQYCYSNMFYHCTSLKEAPDLPATTLDQYCYANMFEGCTALETCPSLSATTLPQGCYRQMFYWCSSLTTLPKLPATTVPTYAYNWMFNYCSSIKLSTTQVDNYQTAYRIPTTGSGSFSLFSATSMFSNTGWTFTGAPSVNTTYYTSNVLV